jgi:hypothetical protein
VLLQGVDLQTVSYKQLHAQLEDKFKVRTAAVMARTWL